LARKSASATGASFKSTTCRIRASPTSSNTAWSALPSSIGEESRRELAALAGPPRPNDFNSAAADPAADPAAADLETATGLVTPDNVDGTPPPASFLDVDIYYKPDINIYQLYINTTQ
jgi:hypothetical protein